MRTGTETSPKEMAPVQIERGIVGSFPQATGFYARKRGTEEA
jgi:hypothetical protein